MAFEAILSKTPAAPRSWRRITITASLAAHGAALMIGAVHSLWQVEEMPLPSMEVTLTSMEPPPPPPPPPAKKTPRKKHHKVRHQATPDPKQVVKPQDEQKKEEPEPEESDDNGVEGGVVGGIVGGTAQPESKRKKNKRSKPKIVSARIARGQLAINPNSPRYRVSLPPALARTGEVYTALVLVCVSAKGSVTGVRVLKGAGPALDPQFPTVMRRWRYKPLMIDGRPTPFCYRVNYRVSGG
jgi:TonB family protein